MTLWYIFVCVTLIGVKSKYGSCSGNCTGLINVNNIKIYSNRYFTLLVERVKFEYIKEGIACWYGGFFYKSLRKNYKSSILFLPILVLYFFFLRINLKRLAYFVAAKGQGEIKSENIRQI